MSRQSRYLGTPGKITTARETNGGWCAKTRFRDFDGVTRQLRASGRSASAATNELNRKIAERSIPSGGSDLTPESHLSDLITYWLDEISLEGKLAESTVELYERDARTLVLPALGALRLRELSVGTIDRFLKALARKSRSRARHAKVVLSSACGLAARHDAMPANPVRDTARLTKPKLDVRVVTLEELEAIRTAIRGWRTGPGHNGPKSDGQLALIIEVILGTSARIGEVLALRRCDVDVTVEPATVLIGGTVIYSKAHGLFRQDHPKRSRQRRVLSVPSFTAEAIRQRLARVPAAPDALLFVSRKGTPLWPNNVRRQWSAIRNSADALASFDLGDVTPHTFRKTVATLLEREANIELAAETLGHSSVDVTYAHYIQKTHTVDPVTAGILEGLGPDQG